MSENSLVCTTITQKVLQRDLIIPLQPYTTRADLARLALTMADLSLFEPKQLTLLSPSPSKEDDLAQRKESVKFDCSGSPGDPDRNVMALLTKLGKQVEDNSKHIKDLEQQNQDNSKHIKDLGQQNQDHLSERKNLNAQLATLQPIARRILIDTYLSLKGYRPSCGTRSNWISANMIRLLPPTGTTGPAFELKLSSYRKHGDACAHSTQTLAIALALDALGPPDEDLKYIFEECFGHKVGEELNHNIPSTLVEVGKDGVAHLHNTPSPVP